MHDPSPPAGESGASSARDADDIILKALEDTPALELLCVPAVWRSDEVEDDCERRGVALSWT